jgi:ABC-type multidrug transport system ATPase subunit
MSAYLEFKFVTKHFGRVTALRDVGFPVESGQILALLGPNGAGKSTLFGCLLGLLRPSRGEILLNGNPIAEAARLRFGYLPERIALYPQRSVWDNGLFFTRLKGGSADDLKRQLQRVGLAAVVDRGVRQLSKGMLQRLGLAIALCGRPDLLVLDEPFNGLDPALLDGLQDILREENRRGATLLISTHTISAVEALATHVAILLRGRVAAVGALDELRARHDGVSLEAIYHRTARRQHRSEPEEILA